MDTEEQAVGRGSQRGKRPAPTRVRGAVASLLKPADESEGEEREEGVPDRGS